MKVLDNMCSHERLKSTLAQIEIIKAVWWFVVESAREFEEDSICNPNEIVVASTALPLDKRVTFGVKNKTAQNVD